MGSLRFSEKALDKFIDLQLMAAFEANRPQPQGSSYEDSFDYQSDLSEWTRDQFRWVDSERGNARRALLAHLLAAEGLPGEEELLRLRAERDLAEDAYDTLRHFVERDLAIDFEQGFGWTVDGDSEEELFGTLEAAIAKATIIDTAEKTAYIKEIQRLEAALETTRQSRLRELLEAEAREMVERSELSEEDPIEEDSLSTLVTFSTDNGSIDLDVYGNATKFECEPLTITVPEADLNAEEAWDLILCLARAIQEQRKREAGAQDA